MITKTKLRAFTLIEVLMTIAIFVLAFGVINGLVVMIYRTHSYERDQSKAIEEARRGVEIMTKEIRQAQTGEDGSFPIERAGDKEFVFYSDVDGDGAVERVRYFLGTVSSGNKSQECVSFSTGGTCSVNFSNFLSGTLTSAQLKVSLEGDFGASNEYAEIHVDGIKQGDGCHGGCSDCAGAWQGTTTYDVTSQAADGSLTAMADGTSSVNPNCDWVNSNHSMKVRFELTWIESVPGSPHELKKGVIHATDSPAQYLANQEVVSTISAYVRNAPPIFEYFDSNGQKIIQDPAKLVDTKLMKIFLVVNIDINRPPDEFQLESYVQLRNLKSQ